MPPKLGPTTELASLNPGSTFEIWKNEEMDTAGDQLPEKLRLITVEVPFSLCEVEDVAHPRFLGRCRVDSWALVRKVNQ